MMPTCPGKTRAPACERRRTGSENDTTPTRPLARSSANVRARNQLSPLPGTESSSTKRPSSTLSRGLPGRHARTRSLQGTL